MGYAYEEFLNKTIHEQAAEIAALKAEISLLRPLAAASYSTCGKNNCNCPGANRVKDLSESYRKFADIIKKE